MNTTLSLLLALPLLVPLHPSGPGEAAATAPSPRTPAPRAPARSAPALPLSSIERTELAAAERASMHELLDLRGGQSSTNENLWTVLLILGIVVLVVILL